MLFRSSWNGEICYEDGEEYFEHQTKYLSNNDESKIDNFWVIRLEGSGLERRVETYEYIEGNEGVAKFKADNIDKILIIIANTNDPEFINNNNITGNDLFKRYQTINLHQDCTNNGSNNIMMSYKGNHIINIDNTSLLSLNLKRNISKIELNVTVKNRDITVVSAQLKSVYRSIFYCEAILNQRDQRPNTYIDYNLITNNLPSYNKPNKLTWYAPINLKGSKGDSDPKNKSKNAPDNATFIELIVKDKNDKYARYTIYPGANLYNNFDINYNRRYTINLSVNNLTEFNSDSNLTEIEVMDMRYKISNSYIINTTEKNQYYRMSVSRVNEFWNNKNYVGTIDAEKVLSDITNWNIDLIWSDNQNLISKTDNSKILINKSLGIGKDDFFEISVPANFTQYGNFTVGLYIDRNGNGIYDNNEEYLWSWHFWVTDYNPYSLPSNIANNPYGVTVTNGQLHCYEGDVWNTGEYAGKYIMDRNIGASSLTTSGNGTGVLYYQYGRKDPFPANVELYNFNGKIENRFKINSAKITIKESMNQPLVFRNTSGAWSSETSNLSGKLWYDINIGKDEKNKKSIFDPSPYGFKVIRSNAYVNFKINEANDYSTNLIHNDNQLRGGFSDFTKINGLQYFPRKKNTLYNQGDKNIYYPIMGKIDGSSGSLNYPTSTLYYDYNNSYWTVDFTDNDKSQSFSFIRIHGNNKSQIKINNLNHSEGLPVRCVQE